MHCSCTLGGVSKNRHVQLAEQSKRHGHLPLDDAIMSTRLASNYSVYWPFYGLRKKICTEFTIYQFNPYQYATTPPQVTLTIPIYHELKLAHQNQLHRCAPFVDAVTWICLSLIHI